MNCSFKQKFVMKGVLKMLKICVIFNMCLLAMTFDILDEINAELNITTFKINEIMKDRSVLEQSELHLSNLTERYSEFLKYDSVRECVHDKPRNLTNYVKRHILDNLLVNSKVPETHWDEYKLVYEKKYMSDHHESGARDAWHDNLQLVATHNRQYLAGTHQYALHLNHFADLSLPSYMKKILKLVAEKNLHDPAHDRASSAFHNTKSTGLPEHVDWRERGYSPRLEEQWRCGACYAFSVAHAMQAQLLRVKRDGRELSVQQLVDCSGGDGNYGCGGGSLTASLRYAARQGLELETDYPYVGKVGKCKYRKVAVRTRVARWGRLPSDELAMARAVANIGPLAIAIDASPKTFQLYRSGVYDDPTCSGHVNHAMLLVGYTPTYWILMNWWGPRWGEKGYMRIRRGVNRCGIATSPVYVELE